MNKEEHVNNKKELIDQIDRNAHYYILVHPDGETAVTGPMLTLYTWTKSEERWIECVIDEERYKLDDGYIVGVRSIDPGFGRGAFYLKNFISYLKQGYIVKKEAEVEFDEVGCIVQESEVEFEEVHWEEPLTPTVNVRHYGYVMKKVPFRKR